MIDIVIASVPKVSTQAPLVAPSLLKTIVIQHGFTCKVKDWNYDLHERSKDSKLLRRKDLTFDDPKKFQIIWNDRLKDIAIEWIKEVESDNPEWFGISLLSVKNTLISIEILKLVRKHLPNVKIVIGGDTIKTDSSNLPSGNIDLNIGEYCLKETLIDHYIIGEAENALPALLKGDLSHSGIDGNTPDVVDVRKQPIPDYEDLNMNRYSFYWLNGSRGCINNCTFCDVNYYSNKFRSRNAESIGSEIQSMSSKYGMRRVIFADNLINGNLKEFRSFKYFLPSFNSRNRVKWSGQMVVTSRMVESDYKDAAGCGMVGASLGIESGSEKVRKEMGKKFSNETLFNTLKWYSKYNIKVQMMLIIGWPTETEKDFQQTLDLIKWSSDNDINLEYVNIGATCTTSPILQFVKDFGIKFDEDGEWYYKDNNMKVRTERWWRTKDYCLSLGFEIQDRHTERMKIYHDRYFK